MKLYVRPDGVGTHRVYPRHGISLVDFIEKNNTPDTEFAPEFTGASHYRDASSYSLAVSAPRREIFPEGGKPAFFSATLPVDFVLKQPGAAAFQHLVLEWCNTLKPHTGYAGLGFRTAVLAKLDDGYEVFEYEGGVIIQAGPTPQPGDVNRRNIPNYYRQLSQILTPLRMSFPEGHSFIRVIGRSGSEVSQIKGPASRS